MAGYAPTELSKEKIERMFGTTGEVKQNNLPVVFFDGLRTCVWQGSSMDGMGTTSRRSAASQWRAAKTSVCSPLESTEQLRGGQARREEPVVASCAAASRPV